MPLVTIVLPTIGRPTLGRALDSLLAQDGPDLEILVVASGSRDFRVLSPAVVPGLRDPRVRILRAPSAPNPAAARNVGLTAARGEWLSFLDDDDAYAAGKIARQHELALTTGSPIVLCGARFHLRGRTRLRGVGYSELSGDQLLTSTGLGTPFLFHRRNARVRFDESLHAGEDLHYAQGLLADFGVRTLPVVPAPLVEVFQEQADQERTNLQADAGWRAARKTWWYYGWRYSAEGRRLFHLQSRVTRLKLRGETRQVCRLLPALFRYGGLSQVRFALNALMVSSRLAPRRFVT